MFNAFRIKNVRMFNDKDWNFKLSPLTVLCGNNGSGKSTIIKTLLLLKQSQSSFKSAKLNKGYLRFVGDYVDLGSYDSFVSYNKSNDNIEISLTNSDLMPKKAHDFLCNYAGIKIKEKSKEKNEENEYLEYELETNFIFTRSEDTYEYINGKKRFNLNNNFQGSNGTLLEVRFKLLLNDELALAWHIVGEDTNENGEIIRKYRMHIPHNYFKLVGGMKMMCVDDEDEKGYISLEVILNGLFPASLLAKWKDGGKKNKKKSDKDRFPLPPAIDRVIGSLIDRLDSIHHIGPLRAPGKRYYLANNDETVLDSVGEFLPYILRDRKDHIVFNCFPNKNWDCEETKLFDALNYWLYYFRTGKYANKSVYKHEIQVKTKESVLVNFELKNQNGDFSFSLADSGFGYSQILPIIVKCLMAEFDDTIIIEQPELHLNPALQVRLAEFFVAMSASLKQILIETHSEHIVNAIRVLSAESEDTDIRDNTKIFFIENKNETPFVHELSIGADGTVPNWPKDFFGEALSLSGRLLRAQKQIRTKIKGESNASPA